MSLIVSVRSPDGIVIAGDSLLVLMKLGQQNIKANVTCPECNHKHEIQKKLSFPPMPVGTFLYSQNVFSFCGKFGIGVYQTGLLAEKSIFFTIRALEQKLKESSAQKGVTDIAKEIHAEIHNRLVEHLERENTSLDVLQKDQILLGFQVVGYDEMEPKTVDVSVAKDLSPNILEKLGCTVSGNREIIQAIWDLYKKHPDSQPPYEMFSLQDAVDYAEFLIHTTIAHQRFSLTIPNVGGDIDIAVITPFEGFKWIRQKSLGKIMEEN